ncbi:MAG: GNAT family N-acetyltransferase [Pseudomonadales bacterium]|jgi:GNAT superfamily N-acetyltransferase|nr:GNAT family N-acetyltransferase [Pseudomonadales bacterium]
MIRLARVNEILAVVELYRGYGRPPDHAIDLVELENRFDQINRSGYVAVAVVGAAIVGTYSMYFCSNLAHGGRPFAIIENVIVASKARRQGIGRALMAHAQQSARDKNCYKVMLATGAQHSQNIKFYGACGFVGNKVGFQVRYGA